MELELAQPVVQSLCPLSYPSYAMYFVTLRVYIYRRRLLFPSEKQTNSY